MNGHVVTFYSYKGGSGRTFALANVAAVTPPHVDVWRRYRDQPAPPRPSEAPEVAHRAL